MDILIQTNNWFISAKDKSELNVYIKTFNKFSDNIEQIKNANIGESTKIMLQKNGKLICDYFKTHIFVMSNVFANYDTFNKYDINAFVFAMNKFVESNNANVFIFCNTNDLIYSAYELLLPNVKANVYIGDQIEKYLESINYKLTIKDKNIYDYFNTATSTRQDIVRILAMPNISFANDEEQNIFVQLLDAHLGTNHYALIGNHNTNVSYGNYCKSATSLLQQTIDCINMNFVYFVNSCNPQLSCINNKSMLLSLKFIYNANSHIDCHELCVCDDLANKCIGTINKISLTFNNCTDEFIAKTINAHKLTGASIDIRNNNQLNTLYAKEKEAINNIIGIQQSPESIFSDSLANYETHIAQLFAKCYCDNYTDDNQILYNHVIKQNTIIVNGEYANHTQYRRRYDLRSLSFANFLCFSNETKIDFKGNNGIIALKGENGNGKTSIIDALLISLFMSKSSCDSLPTYINKNTSASSFTLTSELEYKNENKILVLNRKRGSIISDLLSFKTIINENISELDVSALAFNAINGIIDKCRNDIVINGYTNVEKALANYIGNYDIIVNSCFCLQRCGINFYNLTQTNQRRLLEKIFGLEYINALCAKSKEQLKSAPIQEDAPKYNSTELKERIAKLNTALSAINNNQNKCNAEIAKMDDEKISILSQLHSKTYIDAIIKKYNIKNCNIDTIRELQASIKNGNYIKELTERANNIGALQKVNTDILVSYFINIDLAKFVDIDYVNSIIADYESEYDDNIKCIDLLSHAKLYKKYNALYKETNELAYKESANNVKEEAKKYSEYQEWCKIKQELLKVHDNAQYSKYMFEINRYNDAKEKGIIDIFYDELRIVEKYYETELLIEKRLEEIRDNMCDVKKIITDLNIKRKNIEIALNEHEQKLKLSIEYEKSIYNKTLENEIYVRINECYNGKNNIKSRILAHKLFTFVQCINNILLELGANLEINIFIENDMINTHFKSDGCFKSISLASGYQFNMIDIATRIAIWQTYGDSLPNFFIFDESFVYTSNANLEKIYKYIASIKQMQFAIIISNNQIVDKYANKIYYICRNNISSYISDNNDANNANITNGEIIDTSSPEYLAIINLNKLPEHISKLDDIYICGVCNVTIKYSYYINRHIKSKAHVRSIAKIITVN